VDTISYAGQALTLKGGVQQSSGDYPRTEIWYLINPPVGSSTIVLTLSAGTDYMQCAALNLINVNQSSPLGLPVYDWGAAGPAVALVACEAGDMVIDGICHKTTAAIPGAGQTSRYSGSSDGTWRGSVSTEPGGVGVEMRWTVPSGGFAQMAVAGRHV